MMHIVLNIIYAVIGVDETFLCGYPFVILGGDSMLKFLEAMIFFWQWWTVLENLQNLPAGRNHKNLPVDTLVPVAGRGFGL